MSKKAMFIDITKFIFCKLYKLDNDKYYLIIIDDKWIY